MKDTNNYFYLNKRRLKLDNSRDQILPEFCDNCIMPPHALNCGRIFRQFLLEPIRCPSDLIETHRVCNYCLDVYQINQNHISNCSFSINQIPINAIGWATPASTKVLQGLRRANFAYKKPLSNLLIAFFQHLSYSGSVLVPIPMGNSSHKTNAWLQVMAEVGTFFQDLHIIHAITREKNKSTRHSNLQERQALAENEYQLNEIAASKLVNQKIFLLDDNVTTGTTILQAVKLLRHTGPAEIIPVTIERYVSPRVLQRCLGLSDNEKNCPYYLSA